MPRMGVGKEVGMQALWLQWIKCLRAGRKQSTEVDGQGCVVTFVTKSNAVTCQPLLGAGRHVQLTIQAGPVRPLACAGRCSTRAPLTIHS
eukprot:5777427-Amphidinium_carterae.1